LTPRELEWGWQKSSQFFTAASKGAAGPVDTGTSKPTT
jgi:hypothetical protein